MPDVFYAPAKLSDDRSFRLLRAFSPERENTMSNKFLLQISALMLVLVLFASCSAQRRFQRRLIGNWNVERYEQLFPSGQKEEFRSVGTIRFNTNGTGENDLSILTRNVRQPGDRGFNWINTEASVTITSNNTYLAKAWIVIQNKGSYQVWKSTSQTVVQTMELRRAD